jgi:hypothetical protein
MDLSLNFEKVRRTEEYQKLTDSTFNLKIIKPPPQAGTGRP